MKTEKELADYIQDAIKHDYLLTILITSHTQGKVKSQNLPFGLGKTTLALWLSYYLNQKNWETVFQYLNYNPYEVVTLLEPGSNRKNGAVWDEVQMTAPAEQGVPRVIRRLTSYLSTTRPEVACLIMTASNMNSIASPLRKIILFEVIVAERGYYEVQKITYHKNFRKPLVDLNRLEYLEEGTFPKCPTEVYERYIDWRVKEKMLLYPALKSEVLAYIKAHEETELGLSKFQAPVIRTSGRYVVEVPKALGEKLHRQPIQVEIKTP